MTACGCPADVKVLKLDDKVATLHFLANNVEVTVLETIPGVTTIVIRLVRFS